MIPEHTYRTPANDDDRFRVIGWRIILVALGAFWSAVVLAVFS